MITRFYLRPSQGLLGSSILRVGLATTMFITYLWNITTCREIWGSSGQIDFATFAKDAASDPFSLYKYFPGDAYFVTLYGISAIISLLLIVGMFSRLTSVLFTVTTYALLHRNSFAADAGGYLMVNLSILSCLSHSNAHLAVFKKPMTFGALENAHVVMLHNLSRSLVAFQVCTVYFWASLYKVSGSTWQNGTALSYVFSIDRFMTIPNLSRVLSGNEVAIAILTYVTLLFQLSFPFLMWNERIRPALVTVAVAIHLSIAFLMGLWSLSFTMIVADVSLLSDGDFMAIRKAMLQCRTRILRSWLGDEVARYSVRGDNRGSAA